MYLIKNAIRVFLYYRSSGWKRTIALVTGHAVFEPCFGCPSVKLFYKFDSEGHSTKSWDVIPFSGVLRAKAYVKSLPHNLPRTVRVNPENPQETRFFEWDQKG
jgi:hypothetical protein